MTAQEETRGEAIKRRQRKVGISDRQFAKRFGIDRGALADAKADLSTVGDMTWARIENALEALEQEMGMDTALPVVGTIELLDGTMVRFQGSPEDVADTVARYFAQGGPGIEL